MPTKRGMEFIQRLQRRHGFNLYDLNTVLELIKEHAHIQPTNLILAGYRNKKFIFAPLADEY